MPPSIRPLARTSYYALRTAKAHVLARAWIGYGGTVRDPVFIIGCGRSGTTLLGRIFAEHSAVSYLNEPFDLWSAVDPMTDVLQLYTRGGHSSLLDGSSVTPTSQRRFSRLMAPRPGLILVEKSPINALRIGYLNELAPDARFVHIVRDGVDVVQSIAKMAAVTNELAFRRPLNDWWGVDDAKWASLERDGRAAGYYPEEVVRLADDAQRGAYEWLVSLHEVEGWRERLGSRLVEFRYADLVDDPRETLRGMASALGLACPEQWLEWAMVEVNRRSERRPSTLALPRTMCRDFNMFQEKFGFKGRSVPLSDI